MTQITNGPDEIHQHSGWWFPFAVFIVIVLLSAAVLLYYLRPGMVPGGGGRTTDTAPVTLTVRGVKLVIPANYLDNGAGGEQDTATLSALLPDMRGYSAADAHLFLGNAPDSPVVHMQFKGDENDLDAAGRLERIYRPYIVDPAGSPGDFGLTRYSFRADSGYGREDLFTGSQNGRLNLFLCERADPQLASPNCLAIGRTVAKNLSFSYRFKRAYLARWREIAAGTDSLLARFTAH